MPKGVKEVDGESKSSRWWSTLHKGTARSLPVILIRVMGGALSPPYSLIPLMRSEVPSGFEISIGEDVILTSGVSMSAST